MTQGRAPPAARSTKPIPFGARPDVDLKWLSDATYVDDGGRMVSRYKSDGDGLADADELLLYGTLRYDARTRADAPRIRRFWRHAFWGSRRLPRTPPPKPQARVLARRR